MPRGSSIPSPIFRLPSIPAEQPRYPISDLHIGWDVQQGDFRTFRVQSHTDLRPSPRVSPATTFTGRVTRPSDNEQVVVEYIQSGDVLFTGADACCPTTASLLSAEKAAGTYLQGLGPAAVGRGGSSRSGPVITRQGNGGGSRAAVAPRALVCIDVATGRRFKAVPVEGAIEAVHSAGHYAVMAVAPLQSYPEGLNGSLVVLDFSQEGFGLSEAQRAQQAQAQRGHRRQTATSTAWESRGAGGSVTGAGEVEAEPEAAMQAGRVGTGRGKRKKRPHSSQHLS